MKRSSGILMPMSSLPGKYGIGTMGKSAFEFINFLEQSGQHYWQLLPLGPTGYGDSPYASFSSFAGSPYYIDLELLVEAGLLMPGEPEKFNWGAAAERTDYGALYDSRYTVLRMAFARADAKLKAEMAAFRAENRGWIENYALFMAAKQHFGGACWTEWEDEELRLHKSGAVEKYSAMLSDEIDFQVFMQYLFFSQWSELKAYAAKKQVSFIGDVPIYVAPDSADVWGEQQFFRLDSSGHPTEVAGVPPDDFTADGQLWGNPLYNWDAMREDGYGWWIRRIDGARRLFDVIRIDHFRGFESYWAVPAGESTAKNGKWLPGPGMALVGVLTSWFGDVKFIAEDLGYITPGVRKLLDDSGLPGMKVLEFAFDPKTETDYLPHSCIPHSVCYIGTHDNETVSGWVQSASRAELDYAAEYMHITEDEGWHRGLIRTGMACSSELFIMQMQDVLGLPSSSRMNTPGTTQGNWQWRMLPGAADETLAERLKTVTEIYKRV